MNAVTGSNTHIMASYLAEYLNLKNRNKNESFSLKLVALLLLVFFMILLEIAD